MPLESKRVASLLLSSPDEAAWVDAIEVQNILQKKTPATARRQATLIRKRLLTLDREGWQLLVTRESEVTYQLLLAAAIKHSRLLGDFLLQVYAQRQRKLEVGLTHTDWEDFLAECGHNDPAVLKWSVSTKAKLFQVIVRVLVETKYLENPKTMSLTPKSLHRDVLQYLRSRDEDYVIACLERMK
jgi:integrase